MHWSSYTNILREYLKISFTRLAYFFPKRSIMRSTKGIINLPPKKENHLKEKEGIRDILLETVAHLMISWMENIQFATRMAYITGILFKLIVLYTYIMWNQGSCSNLYWETVFCVCLVKTKSPFFGTETKSSSKLMRHVISFASICMKILKNQ